MDLTQYDIMTSHVIADWFSPVSVANELAAQHSNIWLMLVVAVAVHLPQLHLIRSAMGSSCMLYVGYSIYFICAPAVLII